MRSAVLAFEEKAFVAVDRSDSSWFKWNFGLLAAFRAWHAGAVIYAFALFLHAQ
jgi:hypothetical protein